MVALLCRPTFFLLLLLPFWSIDLFDIIFQSITRAYGRVDADGSRYLLSDHAGLLHLLVISHDKDKYDISFNVPTYVFNVIAIKIRLKQIIKA